jgi:hypothetical protein
MKKNILTAGLLYLWQLPQHLLGLLLILLLRGQPERKWESARVYRTRWRIGLSLGDYILMYRNAENLRIISHEWGHTRQSRLLGPLYLPIVGLPSLTMNLASKAGLLRQDRYFLRWPENWADRLGGVSVEKGEGRA